MKELQYGDHVKIPDNYSTGTIYMDGVSKPMISDYAGKEGIVIEGNRSCGIFIKNHGRVWWFDADRLELISHNKEDLLKEWQEYLDNKAKIESDIDWIFENGKQVLKSCSGATLSTLGKCFGVTNLWGANGEGFVYYGYARHILLIAKPYLLTGDKDGFLKYIESKRKS